MPAGACPDLIGGGHVSRWCVGDQMYKDLREFIQQVESLQALRHVEGADPRFEIGGITEVAAGAARLPRSAVRQHPGFPRGFRVFTNATTSLQRAALALGIDPRARPLDALKAWKAKRQQLQPRPPVSVEAAAFLENSVRGDAVDLDRVPVPVPHWHPKDGGPYIGLGSLVVMRDPDVAGSMPRSIGCRCTTGTGSPSSSLHHAGRHGAIIAQKYWDPGTGVPGGGGQRRGSSAVHRRVRVSARRASRSTRSPARSKGPRSRSAPGRENGAAATRTGGDHPGRASAADERGHAAGGAVRGVHGLLRRGPPAPAR